MPTGVKEGSRGKATPRLKVLQNGKPLKRATSRQSATSSHSKMCTKSTSLLQQQAQMSRNFPHQTLDADSSAHSVHSMALIQKQLHTISASSFKNPLTAAEQKKKQGAESSRSTFSNSSQRIQNPNKLQLPAQTP